MKKFLHIFSILVISFLLGWFLIDFLTVHPLKVNLFLILSILSLVFLIFLVYTFWKNTMRGLTILISLSGFLTGYLLHADIFLNQEDPRYIPELTRQAGDISEGHTAVIYFTHGEPETYSPIGWINQFREFDEQDIQFIPFFARPVFIYILRNKYLEAGKSNHRFVHHQMLKSLENLYRIQGDSTTRFYICFLDDEPRPDAAVIQALNEGADTIIVSTVFVSISNHTAEGKNLIDEVQVSEKFGVPVLYSEPLWNSTMLHSAFPEKVEAAMRGNSKEEIAVLLVGHGQPEEWDLEWPTETEHEIAFRQGIIEQFAERGFKRENLALAWMEFKEPKPFDLIPGFIENGVKEIYYFSAAISADAIHSQIDIPRLIEEYHLPADVRTINMGAWNNHPTVIAAIKDRIDETAGW
jgi:sirohydrochlorin ferrochelatase